MNYPESTRSSGRSGLSGGMTVVQVALATAVAAFAMGLFGASVAGSTGNVTAGVLVRGLLALTLVLLITRALGARARRSRVDRPDLFVLVGALCGYVLDPLSLVGRSALTQLATDPGLVTVAGDLVLWMAVAALGVRWSAREVAGPVPTATPYG